MESIQNLATFYKALQALPRSTSTADLSEWFEHLIDQVRHRCDTVNSSEENSALQIPATMAQHDAARNVLRSTS